MGLASKICLLILLQWSVIEKEGTVCSAILETEPSVSRCAKAGSIWMVDDQYVLQLMKKV